MTPARYHPGLFKNRYPELRGRDWIRTIEAEDLQAFVGIGNEHNDHGHQGGIARAQAAQRDERGRFKKDAEIFYD